jgi:hypothetical protein
MIRTDINQQLVLTHTIHQTLTTWPLKIEPIGSSETSVLNQCTPHNNSKDGRLQFNCDGSLAVIPEVTRQLCYKNVLSQNFESTKNCVYYLHKKHDVLKCWPIKVLSSVVWVTTCCFCTSGKYCVKRNIDRKCCGLFMKGRAEIFFS